MIGWCLLLSTPGDDTNTATTCLVAHVERPHDLENGDLEGEVEGRDDRHGACRRPFGIDSVPRQDAQDASKRDW